MDDGVIGAAEAAAILGVTSSAVRWMAGNGRLPLARDRAGPRARYAFRRADVLALAPGRPGRTADDRSVGAREAARTLGVNRATVMNWANRGLLLRRTSPWLPQ